MLSFQTAVENLRLTLIISMHIYAKYKIFAMKESKKKACAKKVKNASLQFSQLFLAIVEKKNQQKTKDENIPKI